MTGALDLIVSGPHSRYIQSSLIDIYLSTTTTVPIPGTFWHRTPPHSLLSVTLIYLEDGCTLVVCVCVQLVALSLTTFSLCVCLEKDLFPLIHLGFLSRFVWFDRNELPWRVVTCLSCLSISQENVIVMFHPTILSREVSEHTLNCALYGTQRLDGVWINLPTFPTGCWSVSWFYLFPQNCVVIE